MKEARRDAGRKQIFIEVDEYDWQGMVAPDPASYLKDGG
jgi:hypothetical protein